MNDSHSPSYVLLHTPTILLPPTLAQAVVSFEGIGLVLPIYEAMGSKQHFSKVICGSMVLITSFFLALGSIGYLTFGASTDTFVTLNLDPGPFALAARAMFASAILLCYPLNIYPAIQSLEHVLGIGDSSPLDVAANPADAAGWRRAALRNLARALLVGGAYAFAIAAKDAYDNLTGLTGGLCAVPLAFIFPGLFHYKMHPDASRAAKAFDIGLVVFGAIMAPLAVVTALITWK